MKVFPLHFHHSSQPIHSELREKESLTLKGKVEESPHRAGIPLTPFLRFAIVP